MRSGTCQCANQPTARALRSSAEVTETVTAAGRALLNYVNRKPTGRSGCPLRALRNARLIWAHREGFIEGLPVPRSRRAPGRDRSVFGLLRMMGSVAAGVRQVTRLNASGAIVASKSMPHAWSSVS